MLTPILTTCFPLTSDHRYDGYSKELVDRFGSMGFSIEQVVTAFHRAGIDRNSGQDYELTEGQMGDITARLLGEA